MLCPQLCQAASTYHDGDVGNEGIDGGGDGSDDDDQDQLAKTWMEAEIVSGYPTTRVSLWLRLQWHWGHSWGVLRPQHRTLRDFDYSDYDDGDEKLSIMMTKNLGRFKSTALKSLLCWVPRNDQATPINLIIMVKMMMMISIDCHPWNDDQLIMIIPMIMMMISIDSHPWVIIVEIPNKLSSHVISHLRPSLWWS